MSVSVSDWTDKNPKVLIDLIGKVWPPREAKRMVGRGGLEPPTSRLSGVRSNHLSYRPIPMGPPEVVEPRRIELLTS